MPPRMRSTAFTNLGFDPDYLPTLEDKLFIEGPQTGRRLLNFFALLLFATFIATYGVLSNSTATVIGAMIIAPLMGPIMATTAAVVMGSLPRALRSAGLVLSGVVMVIGCSFVLSEALPEMSISFVGNDEIASRIHPDLYALLTALGSGAAGAFITSRAEIADSMGGVAIAISLVPPLCVVGIALQQGQFGPALGAMLLFLTNFLAILLAGGLVLVAMGLSALSVTPEQSRLRKRGLAVFAIGILIVALPLSWTTYQTLQYRLDTGKATAVVNEWLVGSGFQVLMVDVAGSQVNAAIEGSGEVQPAQELAERLADSLGRPIRLNIRTIDSQLAEAVEP